MQPSSATKTLADSQEKSHHRLLPAVFIAVAFLYWTSLYLYVPTLPVYVQSKANNLALVGGILAMYGLWQAIIRLPLGITADWLGRRKPFIIAGLCLSAFGAWMLGSAGSAAGLTVGRAVTGLAAGTWVPLVVIYSSLFPAKAAVRAAAVMTLVSSVSRMLATAVTGSLNVWGGYSLAFNLAAGTALLAALVMLLTPEKARPVRKPSVAGIGRLVARRDVLVPSLLGAVGQYAVWATTFGFIPILARQFGAGDVMQSVLVTVNIAVVALGNLLTSWIVQRVSGRTLVYASFVINAFGILAAAFAGSLAWVFAAQILIGLATGINYPVLMGMSIEQVGENERTTAMGVYQSVYAIGMFGGPWLSGILAEAVGLQPMFGVTAGACLVLGLLGTSILKSSADAAGNLST